MYKNIVNSICYVFITYTIDNVTFLCHHPKHLLRSILHIFIRDVLMHRLLKCHRTRQNREYGINERWILLSGACAAMLDAAGKHDDFAATGFGAAGDTDRGLAHRGLTIEAALSGYDDVGGAKFGFRQDCIKDDIDSRTECAVQVRCKSETKSTCGPACRELRLPLRESIATITFIHFLLPIYLHNFYLVHLFTKTQHFLFIL